MPSQKKKTPIGQNTFYIKTCMKSLKNLPVQYLRKFSNHILPTQLKEGSKHIKTLPL